MPHNCSDCPRRNSCNSAMGLGDCSFFPAPIEHQSFVQRITKFFAKFFR